MNVVLQIGQCGNQLGKQFFCDLAQSVSSVNGSKNDFEDTKNRFFSEESNGEPFARAILVDTEPKVINQALQDAKHQAIFQYHPSNTFVKQEGAANNWAMGYFDHGTNAQDTIYELVQTEVERCDNLHSFLLFMSVAGGTGSGLGTYITEMLKEEYSSVPILNQVVFPFYRGEVTVQSYNALFTLHHLQNTSDAIMMLENDQLYKICTDRIGLKDVSLNDLNAIASQQLVCLLLSSKRASGFSSYFGDILAHLVPHPQFKLLNLRSVPQEPASCHSFSSYPWKSLLRSLRRMLLYNSIVEERISFDEKSEKGPREVPVSLANLLLLRGSGVESVNPESLHQPSLPYASWVPEDARLKTWTHPTPLFKQQRIATVANNGQVPIPRIDEAIETAWRMYNTKAFLHQYNMFGLENDDVFSAFMVVEQMIASYKSLKC